MWFTSQIKTILNSELWRIPSGPQGRLLRRPLPLTLRRRLRSLPRCKWRSYSYGIATYSSVELKTYFTLLYFILFYFILFHFILFYFILFCGKLSLNIVSQASVAFSHDSSNNLSITLSHFPSSLGFSLCCSCRHYYYYYYGSDRGCRCWRNRCWSRCCRSYKLLFVPASAAAVESSATVAEQSWIDNYYFYFYWAYVQ